jgi:acyl-CoA reductase-like NAD-dependent aldehyde dehydrogenase
MVWPLLSKNFRKVERISAAFMGATPLSALAVAELAQRAGMPPGVLNVLTADAQRSIEVGKVLCASDTVRHLSFTGSTEVGRILMQQCAPTIKKLSLELGGNAPLIVFDDADLDVAVEGALASKYRNSGQTCVCANRMYVQAGIYDAFVTRLAARVAEIRVGNGFEQGVGQGPLIDAEALNKVETLVADAVAKGAKVLTGGAPAQVEGGSFYQPTVLANVSSDMRVAREEIFGPVAPVFKFRPRPRPLRPPTTPSSAWPATSSAATWPHLPRGRGAGVRHGGGEHRHDLALRGTLWRGQTVGPGPRRCPPRHG